MDEAEERKRVRGLAEQVAEIASTEEMAGRRRRWADVYMLRKPDRAPVWCNPGGEALAEIPGYEAPRSRDPFYRNEEAYLRRILIHHRLGDDAVVLPHRHVRAATRVEGGHLWGIPARFTQPGDPRGAWAYDPVIKTEADLDKLRQPVWIHDEAETQRTLDRAHDLYDGIMPVKMVGHPALACNPIMGRHATDLIGLEAMLVNMALAPSFVHRLMAFLRDSVLSTIDQMGAMKLLTENNDEPIHFSEPLKTTGPETPVASTDLWLRLESQQFERVSPAMWEEFCLAYQRPIMERFRFVSYGCCENLTDRIDTVLAIPNLRIFINGPWTDLRTSAEKCGGRACIVWRQRATDVVFAPDMAPIRRGLEEGLRITAGCCRAVVLQEVMTTAGNPGRLFEWSEAAKRASEEIG